MVNDEAPIATMLLPISIAPMKRSRWPSSRLTIAARTSPLFSSASMRAREAAVKAVSAAGKKAESTSDRMTIAAASQRLI